MNKFLSDFETYSDKLKKAWEDKYPCGEGGWIYYQILKEQEIEEVFKLISMKKSIMKKK